MDTIRNCPGCQKLLDASMPEGLCPECLLKAGLGTGVDMGQDSRGESGQTPFVAPSVEEVARLFPQLEILGFIGQGGMGAVYKARQKALDRVVALKILPPGIGKDLAFAQRFTREAKALAKLNHPGIVTLYEFGQADGLFFFLMEFADGVTLRHLLEAGRLSAREALAIVPQICDALQYAHDQGIVHRDIKPENILLDRQGRVKVADFGLAKIVGTDALTPALSHPMGEGGAAAPGEGVTPPAVLTEAGKVMGTPQYMAPEQREHPTEVDHRADIYALGVVFYQMLTGELPGKPIEAPSSKVQIDVRLDEVVLRALEKNPELRYQQVSEVKTMVESISSSSSPVTGTDPSPARPAATRGRLRAALIVGVLVWLFVTGTVTLITWIRAESWKVVAVISCPLKSRPGRPVEDHFKFTATMIELIRSDVILGRVIDRLKLDEDSGKLDERWGKRNLVLKLTKAQAMVLLKRRLDVRSEGGTLIQVGVFGKRPEEPEEAMDIANTIAEELRAFRIEQHDSPADMLEMTLRFTPPYILLGLAAGLVLGLLAGGLVLWRGFLRRGSQASPVKTAVETIATMGQAEAGVSVAPSPANRTDNSAPRRLNVGTSLVTTPEQLGTFEGQFFLYRRKSQMLLEDRQLTFARGGTTTVIPLAAIRDLSIGHYPRTVHPAGLDFISVTYDEGGQTKRLFFSPYESWFGLPSHFNQFVAEWFAAIRVAVVAATGREPGNTPAAQLGVPSGSKVIYALLLAPVVLCGVFLLAGVVMGVYQFEGDAATHSFLGGWWVIILGMLAVGFLALALRRLFGGLRKPAVVTPPAGTRKVAAIVVAALLLIPAVLLGVRFLTGRSEDSGSTPAPTSAFGPEITQVLGAVEGDTTHWLDLDTGRQMPLSFPDDEAAKLALFRTNGLDLMGIVTKDEIGVACREMVVRQVEGSRWDRASAQEIVSETASAPVGSGADDVAVITTIPRRKVTMFFRTREGGHGVLQIIGQRESPLGVKIRYKLVQRGEGAGKQSAQIESIEKASSTQPGGPWTARLPSGVTVELLGVAENPSLHRPWWRPDGSFLQSAPYDFLGASVVDESGMVTREIAVRLRNLPAAPVDVQWRFDPPCDSSGGGMPTRLGTRVADLRAIAVRVPASTPTITVRVRVAIGKPQTGSESRAAAEWVEFRDVTLHPKQPLAGTNATTFGPVIERAAHVPSQMDFRVTRVEVPPGTRDILLHFERDTNYGLAFEVSQDLLRGPYDEVPQPGFRDFREKAWVGLNAERMLRWRLPKEFTEDEVLAAAKDLEKRAKEWPRLYEGAQLEFAHVKHRDGWTYVLLARVLREPRS